MDRHPDYEINRELGQCYLFMGDFDKAEDHYRKAVNVTHDTPDPYLGLATVAVQRGDLASAQTLYEQALAIEENDKGLAGMGLVKMELGEHAEAFTYFERAAFANPANPVALNCMVREGYRLGQLERVIDALQNTLVHAPSEDVHTSLAGCLMSLGRHDEALSHLESILAENPASIDARELYEHLIAA